MTIQTVRELFTHAEASGSKSTALRPLGWLATILLGGVIGLIRVGSPGWIIGMMACFCAIALAAYLIAYFWFMVKNPDSLRSEKFTLHKMAMEKGLVGDNLAPRLFSNNDMLNVDRQYTQALSSPGPEQGEN